MLNNLKKIISKLVIRKKVKAIRQLRSKVKFLAFAFYLPFRYIRYLRRSRKFYHSLIKNMQLHVAK